jgi:protein-S-isoprenylcysteine O-methyltransferase Ste14
MMSILKNQKGMNIVGQGGKIILFMLPSLIAAILVHRYLPQSAALPGKIAFIKPLGYLLLLPGLMLWGAAVIQLMTGFSKGRLVTTGAYGVVRNPIYSSVTFFILPGIALLTGTWVYLVASVFLYAGVVIFIGREEQQLAKTFGKEYEDYRTKVDRLVPLKGQHEAKMVRQTLLICGILSSLLYVATDILAVMRWEEYGYTSQTVSELIAINAPTRSFVVPLFVMYSLLVYAFGTGVWRSAGRKSALRLAALGLVGKEVLGLMVTLFFPIHLRGIDVTLTDTMHGILTMAGNLFMLLAIGCGAAAFGKRFRIYSIMTGASLVVFGVLAGMAIPRLAANLPTPWIGVWERINIFAYMLWVVVLAVILLRAEKGPVSFEGNAV